MARKPRSAWRQPLLSLKERLAAGKALRDKLPRSAHCRWKAPNNRPDPVALLQESDRGRLPILLPIRYARMAESPFAFYRGSAALMAHDLASTARHRNPRAGLRGLPRGQFRRLWNSRAAACIRHQRFRRNSSRSVGMGRQTPGSEHRAGHAPGRFRRALLLRSRHSPPRNPTARTCANTMR